MSSSGDPQSKSERTRAKLLDCTVQELFVSSVDQIGFTAIARRANLSTGALYARYENSDELLIDVWNLRAQPRVEQFINDAVEAGRESSDGLALQRILSAMDTQDPELVAGLALMIVARRNDTLKEVVALPIQKMVSDASASFPALVHVLAHLFGELLVARGYGTQTDGWKESVSVLFSVAAGAVPVRHVRTTARPSLSFPDTSPSNIDDFDKVLFAALTEIIGSVGVDRATVSRIARRAGVNPATIYMRFPSKGAMIRSCTAFYLSAVVSGYPILDERAATGDSVIATMEHMFRARMSEKSEMVRRFRLETLFAAWCDPDLTAVYADALAHVARQVSRGDRRMSDIFKLSTFNRISLFGYALLVDFDLVSADDDLIFSIESGMYESLQKH